MKIRIIMLGAIVTPDAMKAIRAFTQLIVAKKEGSKPAEIGAAVGGVLKNNMDLINAFKLGQLSDADFTMQMKTALETATQSTITNDEFNMAWNAMNPSYSQYATSLNEAIEFNKKDNQKIIFISFTNPKDMQFLTEQLKANNIEYKLQDDQLCEIAGISLLTTYVTKKTKVELLELAVAQAKAKPISVLGESLSAALNPGQAKVTDIQYIATENLIEEPSVKQDADKVLQKTCETAEASRIEMIIWKKSTQTLADVLNGNVITPAPAVSMTN